MRTVIALIGFVFAVSLFSTGFAATSVVNGGKRSSSVATLGQKDKNLQTTPPADDMDPLLDEMLSESLREEESPLPLQEKKEPLAVAGKTIQQK